MAGSAVGETQFMSVPNLNVSNLRLLFVCLSGKGQTAASVCVDWKPLGRKGFLTRWEKCDSECNKSNMDLAEMREPRALLLWLCSVFLALWI